MTILARIFPRTRSLLALACLAASLCSQTAFAAASEGQAADAEMRAQQAVAQETVRYVLAGDVEQLEALYLRLNHPGERTPGGLWKLSVFYGQLRNFPTQISHSQKWIEMQEFARHWQASYPDSVPGGLLGVFAKLDEVEIARGASTLDAMPGMHRLLTEIFADEAMKMLEKTRPAAARANDPEWHRTMLNVAPYLDSMSADGYRQKVDEALARHPDYHDAWFTAALFSRPGWGGAPDGVARLARDAGQSTGKEAPSLYARIYWAMDQSTYQGRLFVAGGADWPTMRTSFEHMVGQYPDAWNLNGFAYFACMARDYKTMDAIVGRIGPDVVHAVWGANGKATHARCLAHKAPPRAPRAPKARRL